MKNAFEKSAKRYVCMLKTIEPSIDHHWTFKVVVELQGEVIEAKRVGEDGPESVKPVTIRDKKY